MDELDQGILGGAVKKVYEPMGKKSVCGKVTSIYRKNNGRASSKIYMRKQQAELQTLINAVGLACRYSRSNRLGSRRCANLLGLHVALNTRACETRKV